MASSVFFARYGLPETAAAFSIREDERVPVDLIAKHFGYIPETTTVTDLQDDRSLTLAELRQHLKKYCDGTAALPFTVMGCLGPFEAGFKADFRLFDGSRPVMTLEVVGLLHLSSHTAVYSCKDCNSSEEDELVLKLILKTMQLPWAGPSEVETLKEVMEMRATSPRFLCPSLPEFLGAGAFLANGQRLPTYGDAGGRLIKPRGTCVKGQRWNIQQVRKAAFDVFLALYHLYLLERRHRAVKTDNIIYVQRKDQFVLVDFEIAHRERIMESGELPDSVSLVRSLAEMAACEATAGALERLDPVLGSFAQHAFSLKDAREIPNYKFWLHQLAAACGVDAATLKPMLAKVF